MKRRREDEEHSKKLFPLPQPLQGRFVLYGNICLDCVLEVPSYPKEDSSQRATGFTKTLGGNGANSCRVLAQLVPSGQSVSSLGIVPAQGDADGEFALKILQAGGVETSLLQRGSAADDAGLPTSFVLLSADSGARTIISSRRGLKEMDASHLKEVLKQVEDGAPLCWCHLECRQMPGVLQMASILRPEVPDFRSPLKPILSVEVEKPALEVGALLPLLQRCDVAFFSSDFIRAQASNLLDTNDVQATAWPCGVCGPLLLRQQSGDRSGFVPGEPSVLLRWKSLVARCISRRRLQSRL